MAALSRCPTRPTTSTPLAYPGSRTGVAGYPQAQWAVLVECATPAIIAAKLGAYRDAEWTVGHPLPAGLDETRLCLADRGLNGYEHWCRARATRAPLRWRCASNRQRPVQRRLSEGSFLSVIRPRTGARRNDKRAAVTVRVIEHTRPDADGTLGRYRLLTTRLDEPQAPVLELAALYHERWEGESVFDELKTPLHQRRRVLRSKTPNLVRQEFDGWVLTHDAVRQPSWQIEPTGGQAPKHALAHHHRTRVAQSASGVPFSSDPTASTVKKDNGLRRPITR